MSYDDFNITSTTTLLVMIGTGNTREDDSDAK